MKGCARGRQRGSAGVGFVWSVDGEIAVCDLAHNHGEDWWGDMVRNSDERLHDVAHVLRPTAEVFGRVVLVLFGAWMMTDLVLAILHVMSYWNSPGSP